MYPEKVCKRSSFMLKNISIKNFILILFYFIYLLSDNKPKTSSKNYFEISKSDETHSLGDGDISLSNCTNSSKTDCEEFHPKKKIKVFPMTKNEIYSLMLSYNGDILRQMTEEEFILALEDRCYFRNLLESNANDPKLPVKFSYMRRRVCHKLFKVFSKLVKNFFKQIII